MRAARIHQYGDPSAIVLSEIERPVPQPGEILVDVKASGVGNWDALARLGRLNLPVSLPLTLGAEIAGVVEAIGPNTRTPLIPANAVYGCTNSGFVGGYAEYALCAAEMLALKPPALSDIAAASLPVAAVTAWQMVVDHARVSPGQTVIVHGAGGNVGAFAAQIASWIGAIVIGSVRDHQAQAEVRAFGASNTFEMDTQTASQFLGTADVVIDTVGGATQPALLAFVKSGGLLISCVSKPDPALARNRHIRVGYLIVDVNTEALNEIAKLIDAGKVTIRKSTTLALAEARIAHEMLDGMRPKPAGKIILCAV